MKKNRSNVARLLLGTLFLFSQMVVFAEDPVEEQVLVTATRIPEQAAALPLAWSAVDENALALTAHVHINEVMQRVPGVWITRGNGQESLPSLRSPVLTGAGSCGAFFMAADGIGLRAPGFCNINQLFDANSEQAGRIEVIKGPATALYGSNAMHGVINILSAAPTPTADHQVAVEAGPYDYYRGRYHYRNTHGAHGLSINLNGVTDGGYKDDSGYDQQKMTLRHDYAGVDWNITSVLDFANLNQETAGFIEDYKAYEDQAKKQNNPNPDAYRDVRSLRAYVKASRSLGEHSTFTLTPYLRDNEMEFLMHFLPWEPVEENGHSSLGIRATVHTDPGDLRWVNGLEAEYTDGWLKEIQEDDFSSSKPAGVHYDYQVDAVTAAAFSQLNYSLGSRWDLNGGLRFEYTEYDYDNRSGDGTACSPNVDDCRFYRPADRTDDFSDFSLNLGASYRLSDNHLAYLRLARGFRAPQATELYRLQEGQQVADLNSEELDNVEIGLRGILGEAFRYDLTAYHMSKDEVIFQDADRQNISGAKTRHDGLELSLDYRFGETWYLGLDANYARHQYDSRVELLGSSGDIKGNDIDTAPRVFGSARLGWNFPALAASDGTAELEWVYLGSHYLEPDNEHEYDGHSLLNLRISAPLSQHWHAALRITNLTDEDYAERADYGFGNYRYFVGQPVGAYLEIGYQFQ